MPWKAFWECLGRALRTPGGGVRAPRDALETPWGAQAAPWATPWRATGDAKESQARRGRREAWPRPKWPPNMAGKVGKLRKPLSEIILLISDFGENLGFR